MNRMDHKMAKSSAAVGRWRFPGRYPAAIGSNARNNSINALEAGLHFNPVQPMTERWKRELRDQYRQRAAGLGREEIMTHQTDSLKSVLRNKHLELALAIRTQTSQLSICEGECELIDRMQGMSGRDQAVTVLGTLTRTLADVEAALEAMQKGSYGTCLECGEPIAARRLQAIPWASHCIRCQEMLERRNHMRVAVPHWDAAA